MASNFVPWVGEGEKGERDGCEGGKSRWYQAHLLRFLSTPIAVHIFARRQVSFSQYKGSTSEGGEIKLVSGCLLGVEEGGRPWPENNNEFHSSSPAFPSTTTFPPSLLLFPFPSLSLHLQLAHSLRTSLSFKTSHLQQFNSKPTSSPLPSLSL